MDYRAGENVTPKPVSNSGLPNCVQFSNLPLISHLNVCKHWMCYWGQVRKPD